MLATEENLKQLSWHEEINKFKTNVEIRLLLSFNNLEKTQWTSVVQFIK